MVEQKDKTVCKERTSQVSQNMLNCVFMRELVPKAPCGGVQWKLFVNFIMSFVQSTEVGMRTIVMLDEQGGKPQRETAKADVMNNDSNQKTPQKRPHTRPKTNNYSLPTEH